MTTSRRYLTMSNDNWDRLDSLTQKLGLLDYGDLLRQLVADGINQAESEVLATENKRLVNQKLKTRMGAMGAATALLKSHLVGGEPIDTGVLSEAISTLEKGLID
ncbi:MAG: hypothetical protein AAGI45_23205 [Cyanobacteria bacterium P01_H01_bin.26]